MLPFCITIVCTSCCTFCILHHVVLHHVSVRYFVFQCVSQEGSCCQYAIFSVPVCQSGGYCSFPAFLWEPLRDGQDRTWISKTEYFGASDLWEKQKYITVKETEIIIQHKVSKVERKWGLLLFLYAATDVWKKHQVAYKHLGLGLALGLGKCVLVTLSKPQKCCMRDKWHCQ